MKGFSLQFDIRRPLRAAAFIALLGSGLLGCGRDSTPAPSIFGIRIAPNPVPVGGKGEITLSVSYPRPHMHFSWTVTGGSLNPTETTNPSTTFVAPEKPTPVRLSVSLEWNGQTVSTREEVVEVVASTETSTFPNALASALGSSPTMISISTVPRCDPKGGPNSEDDIAGLVKLKDSSASVNDYGVVIYTKTDDWWVQPQASYPISTIGSDGSFKETIHTGSEYAVLLVRKDFQPLPRIPVLPPRSGDILEIARVKGKSNSP
ncbi:MAG: hypothetical protein C5B50_05225 [Verrucomicrobia bacterium]|nr:MAG: hypothetical protein C5B50_05225 [Verrucomicrobiota bacterium]